MAQDSELQKLEAFVAKLLQKFSELKAQNGVLQQELQERDSLIDVLQGDISTQESERSEISHRVNSLVDQFEDWELSLDEPETESYQEPVVETQAVDYQTDEVEEPVQHNLFTTSGSGGESAS